MADTVAATYSATALALLKADLGYYDATIPPAVEAELVDNLNFAYQALLNECDIVLNPGNIYDDRLQAMYAAWLYRNKATGAGKNDMLKDAIRNRQVHNVMTGSQDVDEDRV